MPSPTRFGILGSGWIVRKYADACRLLPGLELVAVASRDRDRARAVAAQHNIPRAHTGYEALLADPTVDVVINALHNGLHCEWSIRALQAGKHVLCEKPLACSAAEVERMFAVARQANRQLMEAFMYRFHPQLPLILERVRAGEIGRLLHIRSYRMSQGREPGNPRYDKNAGGGALLDIGCYCVNFSRVVAGAEPIQVAANAHFRAEVDLTLTGTLVFPENLTAQFCCSFESEPSFAAEIVGTAGRISIPHPWMPPVWPTEFTVVRAGKSETIRVAPPEVPAHVFANFALQLAHVAECFRQNRPPLISEADSLGNARTLDSLLAAARRV
ncbi:MAG: Glucose--fructose oxidoreductase [Verrucomicrobiae bacterium]|nr:Glucose--fructose oxidoreductase [Verrucomicrobiae bacterium]